MDLLKRFMKIWILIAISIAVLIVVVNSITGSKNEHAKSNDTKITLPKEANKHVAKAESTNDKIKELATPKFGKITKIEVNDDMGKNDGGKIVLVYIKQENITKRVADMYTTKALSQVFKNKKVNEVTYFWQETLTDEAGHKSFETVEKITMNKDTAKGIDWSNFIYTNLDKVADSYYISSSL